MRIILKWILKKICTVFNCLGIGSCGGFFEHGNEPSGFVRAGNSLTY
jgi:hypothetical protein